MDTGCGHDLISKNRARKLGNDAERSDNPMSFFTPNGVTSTNDVAKTHVDEFGTTHTICPRQIAISAIRRQEVHGRRVFLRLAGKRCAIHDLLTRGRGQHPLYRQR